MSLGRLKMKSSLIRRPKTRPAERDSPGAKAGPSSADERQGCSWPVSGTTQATSDSTDPGYGSTTAQGALVPGTAVGGATTTTAASRWKSRKSVGGTILKSIRRKLPWNRSHGSGASRTATTEVVTVNGPDMLECGDGGGSSSTSWINESTTTNQQQRSTRALRLVDSPPVSRPRIQEEDEENDEEEGERIDSRSPEVESCPPEIESCPPEMGACAAAAAAASATDDNCYMNLESVQTASLTAKLRQLPQNGWYWGPLTRAEAEEKLAEQPDGAFLVRDSSDHHYLLSLSFRSFGKTLHTRIEHRNGVFSFYAQSLSEGHPSIVDLIEHSVNYSQSGVFCYSRARGTGAPSYPVRLTRPLSRFTRVRSLQYLCRFVIRQHTSVDAIGELPLPKPIKGFVEEGYY